MQKILCSVAVSILLTLSAFAQRKTDREREGLIGNVHTVRTEYKILSKTSEKEEFIGCPEVITYDRRGLMTENFHDCANSKVSTKSVFSYNETGRLMEEARYDANKSLLDKTIHTYDDGRKIVEAAEYKADGSLSRKDVFTFPPDYDLDAVEGLHEWDAPFLVHHWIEANHFGANGIDIGRQTAVNINGRREEITQYPEWHPYAKHLNGAKTVYLYNSTGKITGLSYYSPNGTLNRKETWLYDKYGNRLKTIDGDSSGKEWSRAISNFDYDSRGNWLKMTFTDLGTTQVRYRTITYY